MRTNKLYLSDYEQIDLFEEQTSEDQSEKIFAENSFDAWDITRGRNIIRAQGKDGKDVTFYFDALDQQYHLFED